MIRTTADSGDAPWVARDGGGRKAGCLGGGGQRREEELWEQSGELRQSAAEEG